MNISKPMKKGIGITLFIIAVVAVFLLSYYVYNIDTIVIDAIPADTLLVNPDSIIVQDTAVLRDSL